MHAGLDLEVLAEHLKKIGKTYTIYDNFSGQRG